jgi:hypothetical protein
VDDRGSFPIEGFSLFDGFEPDTAKSPRGKPEKHDPERNLLHDFLPLPFKAGRVKVFIPSWPAPVVFQFFHSP